MWAISFSVAFSDMFTIMGFLLVGLLRQKTKAAIV